MARKTALVVTILILGVLGLRYLTIGGNTSGSEITNVALTAIAWALVFVGLSIKEL